MTNALIQMSGVFAELELRIIRARVVSGMRNARAKGAKIGRPQTTLDDIPANFLRHYPVYKNGAFNLSELARLCDISRTAAYTRLPYFFYMVSCFAAREGTRPSPTVFNVYLCVLRQHLLHV